MLILLIHELDECERRPVECDLCGDKMEARSQHGHKCDEMKWLKRRDLKNKRKKAGASKNRKRTKSRVAVEPIQETVSTKNMMTRHGSHHLKGISGFESDLTGANDVRPVGGEENSAVDSEATCERLTPLIVPSVTQPKCSFVQNELSRMPRPTEMVETQKREWRCKQCTFDNDPHSSTCQMCGWRSVGEETMVELCGLSLDSNLSPSFGVHSTETNITRIERGIKSADTSKERPTS